MKALVLILSVLLCLACVPARAGTYLVRVKMTSASTGWAFGTVSGQDTLFRTTDGGRHWGNVSPPGFARTAVHDDAPAFDDTAGFALPDARRGWVAAVEPLPGDWGLGRMHVWRTGDGGAIWRESHFRTQEVGDSVYLQFVDRRHGLLLALGGPAAGLMAKEFYRTGDGGRTWQHMHSPNHEGWSFYPTGMTFRTPTEGWIAATYHSQPDAPFLHTTDGGRTWRNQPLPLPSDGDSVYANTLPPLLFGHDRVLGLFVAEIRNSRFGTFVYGTRDGGRRWHRGGLLPIGDAGDAEDAKLSVSFISPQQGWAADAHRRLFVTQDSGRTWRQIARRLGPPAPTGEEAWEWTQLDFVSPRTGWALFRRRTEKTYFADLYQTRDGGYHWQHVHSGSTLNPLYSEIQRIWKRR